MAKQKTFTLTQTEIISLAIRSLFKDCEKAAGYIANAGRDDPDFQRELKDSYSEQFFKMKKLLELYELQTGVSYDIKADATPELLELLDIQ